MLDVVLYPKNYESSKRSGRISKLYLERVSVETYFLQSTHLNMCQTKTIAQTIDAGLQGPARSSRIVLTYPFFHLFSSF